MDKARSNRLRGKGIDPMAAKGKNEEKEAENHFKPVGKMEIRNDTSTTATKDLGGSSRLGGYRRISGRSPATRWGHQAVMRNSCPSSSKLVSLSVPLAFS